MTYRIQVEFFELNPKDFKNIEKTASQIYHLI